TRRRGRATKKYFEGGRQLQQAGAGPATESCLAAWITFARKPSSGAVSGGADGDWLWRRDRDNSALPPPFSRPWLRRRPNTKAPHVDPARPRTERRPDRLLERPRRPALGRAAGAARESTRPRPRC